MRLESHLRRHWQAALLSFYQLMRRPVANSVICLVIAISLALPMGLYLLLEDIKALNQHWDTNSPIMLYLKKHETEEQAKTLSEEIAARPEVSTVTYVSPEQGLADFEKHTNLKGVLATLPENPLPGLLVVTPTPTWRTSEALSILLESLKNLPQVEVAQLDVDWMKRLDVVLGLGQRVIYAFGLLLGLGVIFIIGSIIHLVTRERKEEVFVFQLVGADQAFIRRPFLYTGMWYGFFGSLLASVLIGIFFYWLAEPSRLLAELYSGVSIIQGLGIGHVLSLLCIGIALGVMGAWIAYTSAGNI